MKRSTTKHTPPLRCHQCGASGDQIRVSESTQMRQARRYDRRRKEVRSMPTEHADVRCGACGHPWWSRSREAISRSRQADYAAAVETGQVR